MRQRFRTIVYMLVVIAIFLVGTIHPAQATLMLRLTEGNNTETITDQVFGIPWLVPGDSAPGVGMIVYTGKVGDFVVSATIASSKPVVGSETSPVLSLTSFSAMSSSAGTLTIAVSDTGFDSSQAPLNFKTSIDGTLVAGTIAAQAYYEYGTVNFTHIDTNLVGSVGPIVGPGGGTDIRGGFSPGTPFSLNLVTTITHSGSGGVTTFDASVKTVPEPSVSLCLGMALFGLAGYGWWSRKKNNTMALG